jgi:hypothetical protein
MGDAHFADVLFAPLRPIAAARADRGRIVQHFKHLMMTTGSRNAPAPILWKRVAQPFFMESPS